MLSTDIEVMLVKVLRLIFQIIKKISNARRETYCALFFNMFKGEERQIGASIALELSKFSKDIEVKLGKVLRLCLLFKNIKGYLSQVGKRIALDFSKVSKNIKVNLGNLLRVSFQTFQLTSKSSWEKYCA